jgi:hypothetical protein
VLSSSVVGPFDTWGTSQTFRSLSRKSMLHDAYSSISERLRTIGHRNVLVWKSAISIQDIDIKRSFGWSGDAQIATHGFDSISSRKQNLSKETPVKQWGQIWSESFSHRCPGLWPFELFFLRLAARSDESFLLAQKDMNRSMIVYGHEK